MNKKEFIKELYKIEDINDLSKGQLITLIDMLVDVIEEYERRYDKIIGKRRH